MNKAIQKQSKSLRDMVISQRNQIAMALPKHMDVDRLIRVSITAMRNNPKILECSQVSVLGSIIQAAQLGLETDGALGHAYLVPYKRQCQLQIGYRGMIDLARRSGQIISISAQVVSENDEFDFSYGLEPCLHHKPNLKDPGEPIAVYAVARLVGGGHQFEVLSLNEIEAAHMASKARSGPWETHWKEMARKTAVRRLFKYLPVSVEIQKAVGLDEQAAAGVPQHLETIFTEAETIEPDEPPLKVVDQIKQSAKEKTETFNPVDELHHIAKEQWGDMWQGALKRSCENQGFMDDTLTDEQASAMIDIINNLPKSEN
jgi:recombination protein RecT